MPFIFTNAPIHGIMIIEPKVFSDDRGYFMESYRESDFSSHGLPYRFVQDNHSSSVRGAIRGLHFQNEPYVQGKLVRVTRGSAWDIALDLRSDSDSFGKYYALELSEKNRLMLWIPPGFAHGFLCLEDGTELQYKCTKEYHADSDTGIRWDDPKLGIEWPLSGIKPIVSRKDQNLPPFDPDYAYFQ